LAIGLKNDVEQAGQLAGVFDFTVNEECFRYGECAALQPFIEAKKPVFHIEYSARTFKNFCKSEFPLKFNFSAKGVVADAYQEVCS
jgi:hypothetical protein